MRIFNSNRSKVRWIGAAIASTVMVLGTAPVSLATDAEAPERLPEQPKSPEPATLDELLGMVKEGFIAESTENKDREARFLAAKDDQQRLLEETLAVLSKEEATSQALETTYNENEPLIGTLQEQLAEILANMPAYDPDKRTSDDQVTEDSDAMKKQLEMLGYLDEEDLEGGE